MAPRIMVLDDEPVARQIMRRYLGLHGYETLEAGTVDEAVETLKREPVDAVILDVRLAEERTGLDVLKSLRRLPGLENLPAIILTGKILDDVEELSITRERAYLFHKPESLDVLINFLDQMLGTDQPQ
ncbi:MAG: response regulator [Vicinamibacterales bacterium]